MKALAALAWAAVLPASACPLPEPALHDGELQAAWQVAGAPVVVGRMFTIELQLCPAAATLLRVDATMPEHGHGMNYRPSVTALGGGRWRAEGLMFHMPGRWDLTFDIVTGNTTQRLASTLRVE